MKNLISHSMYKICILLGVYGELGTITHTNEQWVKSLHGHWLGLWWSNGWVCNDKNGSYVTPFSPPSLTLFPLSPLLSFSLSPSLSPSLPLSLPPSISPSLPLSRFSLYHDSGPSLSPSLPPSLHLTLPPSLSLSSLSLVSLSIMTQVYPSLLPFGTGLMPVLFLDRNAYCFVALTTEKQPIGNICV